jgi:hypothetical protein
MAEQVAVTLRLFDPDDEVDDGYAAFAAGLRRQAGDVVSHHRPPPLAKADPESIILALGSAGVLTAAVEFFRSWLSRDRRRSISMSWHEDGRLHSVEITGDGLDDDAIGGIVDSLARRLDDTD